MADANVCWWCDDCGCEICVGDAFYHIQQCRLCPECMRAYALEFFAVSLEIAK